MYQTKVAINFEETTNRPKDNIYYTIYINNIQKCVLIKLELFVVK